MFDIAVAIISVLAVWLWGDWRHITKYHATLLYLVFGDLYYYFVARNHPLWRLEALPLVPYRVITETLGMICFICSALIFLTHFPKAFFKAVMWIALWVALYTVMEWLMAVFHAIGYYNGWGLSYSIFFDMIMFPMLWLHWRHPIIAYALTLPIIAFLIWVNHVPLY